MGRMRISCPVLEINVISAQDLAAVSRNMKTYAVAWINTDPTRKLTTRVDQTNRANPIWNEKFVFRVKDKVLNTDASAIVIEIYAAAWAKDALVGSVNILLSDLFAPWSGFAENDVGGGGNNNTMRLVTLQVRRPSGRLQGFLRVGVSLLDGTQRSMPLSVEVFDGSHGRKYREMAIDNGGGGGGGENMLRRTHSDQTDLTTSTTTEDYFGERAVVVSGGGNGGRNGGYGGGTDSMVNGSLCNSDIGPSASVVAAAIAHGLYNRQKTPAIKEDASSILEGTTEGVQHRLERWKSETTIMTPNYKDAGSSVYTVAATETGDLSQRRLRKRMGRRRREELRRRDGGGGRRRGLFSCFGKVFGCEISITCGDCGGGGGDGGSSRKKYSNNKVANLSSVDGTFSNSAA